MFTLLKLEDKKQTDQQQKQANHCVSLFYEFGSIRSEREASFKSKNKELSTKKEGSRRIKANWVSVYDGLTAEIRLRRYYP